MKVDEVGAAYRDEMVEWIGDSDEREEAVAEVINLAFRDALATYEYGDAVTLIEDNLGKVPSWLSGAIHNLVIAEDALDIILEEGL